MAPSSSIQFIEKALSNTSSFLLSYSDPDQKWLIRRHLLSLLQDYPSFRLSTDTFFHNDGTTVNLLHVTGSLHVPNSTLSIPLTIWLHQNYPFMPPMAFVSSDPQTPIHLNHPFVDTDGAVSPPYLLTWEHPRCNLIGLMHKLVKIFTHDHPFANSASPSFSHPSLVSRTEALDRLMGMIHYDMIALQVQAGDEIEELTRLQAEMIKRVDATTRMITELEHERMSLKEKVRKMVEDGDVLMNWWRVYDPKSIGATIEDEAFGAAGDESKVVLDSLAGDIGIEDVIYALEKAVEEGALTVDSYIKQVRSLAREQFFHRAKHLESKNSSHD